MNTIVLPRHLAASTQTMGELPVVVIGGGPVGLAAAAHLLARDLEVVVLEAGDSVGASVLAWGHVPMFSPWRFNLDRAAIALLEQDGWTSPDLDAFPTGRDLVEHYLRPLAAVPEIESRLRLEHRVVAVGRSQIGKVRSAGRQHHPLEVRYVDGDGQEGRIYARAVLDASGTWSNPNPAGASGIPAIGERRASDLIRYGMPDVLGADRERYVGRRVLVVGTGHSATGTLIDLATLAEEEPNTTVIWAARSRDFTRVFGGGDNDGLEARGELGSHLERMVRAGRFEIVAPFAVNEIELRDGGGLIVSGDYEGKGQAIECDEVVVGTGFRPDLTFLS